MSIAIVSTHSNGFNYCDLTLTIPFNINYLFAHSLVWFGLVGLMAYQPL